MTRRARGGAAAAGVARAGGDDLRKARRSDRDERGLFVSSAMLLKELEPVAEAEVQGGRAGFVLEPG